MFHFSVEIDARSNWFFARLLLRQFALSCEIDGGMDVRDWCLMDYFPQHSCNHSPISIHSRKLPVQDKENHGRCSDLGALTCYFTSFYLNQWSLLEGLETFFWWVVNNDAMTKNVLCLCTSQYPSGHGSASLFPLASLLSPVRSVWPTRRHIPQHTWPIACDWRTGMRKRVFLVLVKWSVFFSHSDISARILGRSVFFFFFFWVFVCSRPCLTYNFWRSYMSRSISGPLSTWSRTMLWGRVSRIGGKSEKETKKIKILEKQK